MNQPFNQSRAKAFGDAEAKIEELRNHESTIEPSENASEESVQNADDSRLQAAEAALSEAREEHLRLLAEFQNFKKRMQKESSELTKLANERILEDILPVLDNLDMTLIHASPETRASDPIVTGVEMIRKQFVEVLSKHGVSFVDQLGVPFDPNHHEAIASEVKADMPDGSVSIIHRRGVVLHGKLVRAALVTVSQKA